MLNDPKTRAVVAGVAGGMLGSLFAEAVLGAPQSLAATTVFGCLTGLGIGALFGVSEGIGAGTSSIGVRAAVIGGLLGLVGGGVGSGLGQAVAGAGGAGVFSAEMAERLRQAGAKQGEVEIGLIWHNRNDLDLHVLDPRGERIYFGSRLSQTGGELDVDRNAGCGSPTDSPVEHVVWAREAPHGSYKVGVHHYSNCGVSDPTPFEVEIVYGDQKRTLKGSLSRGSPLLLIHEFQYRGPVGERNAAVSWIMRLLGWMLFGLLVGAGQGLARRSKEAVRNLSLGGAVGGAAGGLGFLITSALLAAMGVGDAGSRVLGMGILGAAIGLCMVFAEEALSASLMVVNGRYEGRRIPLDRRIARLGKDELVEIYVGGDPAIARYHCHFTRGDKGFFVEADEGAVEVNGTIVARHELVGGDRLRVGSTKLIFRTQGVTTGGFGGTAQPSDSVRPATSPATAASMNAATPWSQGATVAQPAPRKPPVPPPPPPPRKA